MSFCESEYLGVWLLSQLFHENKHFGCEGNTYFTFGSGATIRADNILNVRRFTAIATKRGGFYSTGITSGAGFIGRIGQSFAVIPAEFNNKSFLPAEADHCPF